MLRSKQPMPMLQLFMLPRQLTDYTPLLLTSTVYLSQCTLLSLIMYPKSGTFKLLRWLKPGHLRIFHPRVRLHFFKHLRLVFCSLSEV